MIIYLVSFFMSTIILNYALKIKDSRSYSKFLIFLSLIIPCILAALRSTMVGTDVRWYAQPLFECARNSTNFSAYYSMKFFNNINFQYFFVKNYEIGFSVLVYVITKLTKNIQFLFFIIELLIVFPIFKGLKKYKGLKDKLWLSMLVFYLLFFNVSLNLMRQFIGMAMVFYGISSLINDNKGGNFKFYLFLFIGFLFHKSSLLGLLIYLIYKILNYQYSKKRIIKISNFIINVNKTLTILIVIFGIFIVLNSNFITILLSKIGLVYYTGYINGNISFLWSKVFKIIPIVFIFLIVYKNFIKENKDSWFYILMFLIEAIILSQFSSVNSQAGRIGYLFQFFDMISFPLLCVSGKKKNTNLIITFFLIIYLVIYWYYTYSLGNSMSTVPYKFFGE